MNEQDNHVTYRMTHEEIAATYLQAAYNEDQHNNASRQRHIDNFIVKRVSLSSVIGRPAVVLLPK